MNTEYIALPADITAILEYVIPPPAPWSRSEHLDVDSEDEVEEQLSVDVTNEEYKIAPSDNVNQHSAGTVTLYHQASLPEMPIEEDAKSKSSSSSVDSGSESDFSTSTSTSSFQTRRGRPRILPHPPTSALTGQDIDDGSISDEDTAAKGPHAFATKNEIVAPKVTLPSIVSVGDDEVLEHIGTVLSIIESVVVVKGVPGSVKEKVLDTGSLLVFDDRKILGEVFETFGPTSLPLYSIRFPSVEHIDTTQVTIGRSVSHVPSRSFFVFMRGLRAIRGSDASNVYDEEVGEEDVEFSDDEKEQEHRKLLKQKRSGKHKEPDHQSLSIQHANTPAAAPYDLHADDDDIPYSSAAYDNDGSSSHQLDPRASSGRAIVPYDNAIPYDNDDSSIPPSDAPRFSHRTTRGKERFDGDREGHSTRGDTSLPVHARRGRGRGRDRDRGALRGVGRGQERGRGRGRGRGGHSRHRDIDSMATQSIERHEEYDPRIPFSQDFYPSSTPFAAGSETGQLANGMQWSFNPTHTTMPMPAGYYGGSDPYHYQQNTFHASDPSGFGNGLPAIAPHINPSFFGFGMGQEMAGYPTQFPGNGFDPSYHQGSSAWDGQSTTQPTEAFVEDTSKSPAKI